MTGVAAEATGVTADVTADAIGAAGAELAGAAAVEVTAEVTVDVAETAGAGAAAWLPRQLA